jgi:uncharacterized membrane protein
MAWFITGWQLFMQNPGVWVLQTLIFIALSFMLGIMPVLGQMIVAVLFPVFCAGMLHGCARLTRGERIEVGHLFEGFRHNTGNLLVLGVGYLMGGGIILLLALMIGGSGALIGMIFSKLGAVFGGMMLFGAVFYLLWIMLLMALWFAPALVMLGGAAPLESLLLSVRACARNLPATALTGVALCVLIWLAMLPAGLGVLVLMPVIAGAVHASWRDVFGHEFDAALEAAVVTDHPQDAR